MKGTLDEHLIGKEERNEKREKQHSVLLILLLLGFVISTSISWYEVESIVGSGPIMSILGIIFSIITYKMKSKFSLFLGLMPLGISIFWVIMIELYNLSPGDCEFIIPLFLSLATVFAFIIGFNIFMKKNALNKL